MNISYSTNRKYTYTNVSEVDKEGATIYSRFGEYLTEDQVRRALEYCRANDRGKTNEQ